MGDLSKHFSKDEFACKCGCGFADVSPELIDALEEMRAAFNKPISINSGCRCKKHNIAVGGEPKSKHMEGIACDLVVHNTPPHKVYQYLDRKYPNKYGIGLYPSWVHLDVRKTKSRWSK